MKNRSITQLAALGVVLLFSAVYLGLGAGPAAADTDPVASRTPDSIDFGNQQAGTTSAARTITVTAVSDGWKQVCNPTQKPPCEIFDVPTRISNLSIGGTNAAAFSVSSQNCTGRYLWQGDTCSIDVTFSPAAVGSYSATLNINSNGSWSTGNQVQLSGNAPPPPTPPNNDNFANAQSISGASATLNGTTLAATRETGEPDHYVTNPPDSDLWVGDHSVWYRWTAPTSGSTTLDTCTANIDSILAVYTGSALTSLSRVADNNNGCPSDWGSKVTFNASAGTTYNIAVGDAGGLRESTFTLKLATAATPPKVDSTSPANGATQIAPGANVTATFSEKMDPLSITKSTFQLFKVNTDGSTTQITNVTVTPSTDGLKATLNPFGTSTTLLAKSTKYKAVVTTGAKDLAGNQLDQNSSLSGLQQKSWTFTTRN